MSGRIVNVTDDDFDQEVLRAEGYILVDFWADWCGPCKMIAPVLEEISEEMVGDLKVVKVDVSENPEAPTKYGVRSIPTLILFQNGEIVDTRSGASPKSQLKDWIESARKS